MSALAVVDQSIAPDNGHTAPFQRDNAGRVEQFPPTRRQLELLRYIAGYMEAHGFAPTLDECCAAMGLAAKSGIHRMLTALEERGHVRRRDVYARAIHVITNPPLPRAPDGAPLWFIPVPSGSN